MTYTALFRHERLRAAALAALLVLPWHARCWGAGPAPGTAPTQELPGDISAEYERIFPEKTRAQGGTVPLQLGEYRVLFVPGFLSNSSVAPELLDKSPQMPKKPYFYSQIAWLRSNGIDARIVDIRSESSVVDNAARVAESVRRSPGPVIIVAHSKGGLDTLEALLAEPDLDAKVAGVITIQSPFKGTLIADYVLENWLTTMWTALSILGGSELSLLDLTVDTRTRYQQDNAEGIAYLTARVPFVSFGSWVDNDDGSMDTENAMIRNFLLEHGMKNDGVVPTESALLPGAYTITAGTPDHNATISESSRIPFDRIAFINTLFELLLARLPAGAIK